MPEGMEDMQISPELEKVMNPDNFMKAYDEDEPAGNMIAEVKKFFPTKETKITKDQYVEALVNFADGHIFMPEGVGLSEEQMKEARDQITSEIKEYLSEAKAAQTEFDLNDLFKDFINHEFYNYIEKKHPEYAQDLDSKADL